MSTYARVNSLTLKVDKVIEASATFFNDREDYDLWIKTSAALTKKRADIGDNYIVVNSAFKPDSPHASHVFNDTSWDWEPPTTSPAGTYQWDEDTTNWVEVT